MLGGGIDYGGVDLAVGLLELNLIDKGGGLGAILLMPGLGDHCVRQQN
jgi:hypothetical protein